MENVTTIFTITLDTHKKKYSHGVKGEWIILELHNQRKRKKNDKSIMEIVILFYIYLFGYKYESSKETSNNNKRSSIKFFLFHRMNFKIIPEKKKLYVRVSSIIKHTSLGQS